MEPNLKKSSARNSSQQVSTSLPGESLKSSSKTQQVNRPKRPVLRPPLSRRKTPQKKPLTQASSKNDKETVIVATSDIHGYLEGIKDICKNRKADILVIAGDIQPADIYFHCNDSACGSWFRNKFFNLVKKLDCEVVAIPGNHDFWLRSLLRGDFGTYDECKQKYFIPDNFHLLCDNEITVKGLRIYGTPWVPWISGHWCWEDYEPNLKAVYDKIPKDLDILVTHTPPRHENKGIDVSLEWDAAKRRHFGSSNLMEAIVEKSPQLVFCGHIHSGDHECLPIYRKSAPRATYIYNVSRVNERYYIGYPFTVIGFREKTIVQDLNVPVEPSA